MHEVQFIECVAERDIDLLFLEELHVSSEFRSWLVSEAFGHETNCARFLGAWHSLTHPTLGESDLVLLFEDSQRGKVALLIENKIDAPPQPEQAQRYGLRGKNGIDEGSWDRFRTCMIAPRAYLERTCDAAGYEVRLSYESIRDWFQRPGVTDERHAYRARMVQEAIEQNRRGFRSAPHPGVTQFWSDYWNLACREFPQLHMKQPRPLAAGNDWPEFRPSALGSGRRIVHKLAFGTVDLEIASACDLAEEIAARNRGLLGGALEVVRTGKSASIRVIVPTVDRFGELSSQAEAVRAGLSAACRLLDLSAQVAVG
jgi:hypothetical protein